MIFKKKNEEEEEKKNQNKKDKKQNKTPHYRYRFVIPFSFFDYRASRSQIAN